MNKLTPTSTIYSTPFALHCRGEDIGPPEDVDLKTFGTLEEYIDVENLLVVDLFLHSLAEEDPDWFPKDTATSNILDHLEDALVPYLNDGGVLTVLVYDNIDIKDSKGEEERWRDNHEWFDSIIPVEIDSGGSQSPNLDSISESKNDISTMLNPLRFDWVLKMFLRSMLRY